MSYATIAVNDAFFNVGKVSTYGGIAKAMGKPRSSRAVGSALKKNPFAPVVWQ